MFVDLSADSDNVNHHRLLQKLLNVNNMHMAYMMKTLIENRPFFVELSGKKSRCHEQKNGLSQGSVLAPNMFNIDLC